nr:uncharacterized protein LOC123287092 isoform X1 [Equus asinus]
MGMEAPGDNRRGPSPVQWGPQGSEQPSEIPHPSPRLFGSSGISNKRDLPFNHPIVFLSFFPHSPRERSYTFKKWCRGEQHVSRRLFLKFGCCRDTLWECRGRDLGGDLRVGHCTEGPPWSPGEATAAGEGACGGRAQESEETGLPLPAGGLPQEMGLPPPVHLLWLPSLKCLHW